MNKNSKKNKKANKCSKPITIKEMIVMGYVLFCLGIIIYGLLLTPILNSILKYLVFELADRYPILYAIYIY